MCNALIGGRPGCVAGSDESTAATRDRGGGAGDGGDCAASNDVTATGGGGDGGHCAASDYQFAFLHVKAVDDAGHDRLPLLKARPRVRN